MDEDFNQLGATEKFAVESLRKALTDCKAASRKVADMFEEIDDSTIDDMMLDPKRKELAIMMIGHLQKLASNLGMSEITVLVVSLAIKPREEKAV